MQRSLTAAAFALAGVAAVLVLQRLSAPEAEPRGRLRAPSVEPGSAANAEGESRQDDTLTVLDRNSPPADTGALNSPARRDPHVDALRHPSEIYRITSLLAVIRRAGYVCRDVLSAAPGAADLGAWRVSCEDARAYLVSESDSGGLRVEPIPFFEVPARRITPVPVQPGDRLPLQPPPLR